MTAIHQFVAGYSQGDAISNEARVLRRIFQSWGHESAIFSEQRRILPELRKDAGDAHAYAATAKPEDIVLLHLSIGSPVNAVFQTLPCRKAILYHNITPAHYFDLINKKTAYDLARGREQIKALRNAATVVMADSAFNAAELVDAGYPQPGVLPLVLDLEQATRSADRSVMSKFRDGRVNVLFVGRCAPNKRIEDLLQAFAHLSRCVEPESRFIHVGSFAGVERYYYFLLARAREMGLTHVHFAGSVPQQQLNAYYRCADVFLCMSEHEGFCIPLLESMAHDVPVLAHAACAVPETMDGAGVLFHRKEYPQIAEMIGRLTKDRALREGVIAAQRERVARYRSRNLEAELREHLSPLLSRPEGGLS